MSKLLRIPSCVPISVIKEAIENHLKETNGPEGMMDRLRNAEDKRMSSTDMDRKNPFDSGPIGSGWLLKNGTFKWANSISSHDALARKLGFKNIEDARDNGGLIRSWADRDDRIITVGVDEFSELNKKQQDAIEKIAKINNGAIRDDRGNIVIDHRI